MGISNSRIPIPDRPEGKRFSARIPHWIFKEGVCTYLIVIQSPPNGQWQSIATASKSASSSRASSSSPKFDKTPLSLLQKLPHKWEIERRYNDFKELHESLENTMYGLNYDVLPELPPSTIFRTRELDFIDGRRRHLEAYLNVLFCKVSPHLKAFRDFLDIPNVIISNGIPADKVLGEHQRLMLPKVSRKSLGPDLVACILQWLPPLEVHRDLSLVCSAFRGAGFHPKCWPSVTFHAQMAERRLEGLFRIFQRTPHVLEKLDLRMHVVTPDSTPLCPCITFTNLRRVSLVLNAPAVDVGVSILDCIEDCNHVLEEFSLEAVFTRELYHACGHVLKTSKMLNKLEILFAPRFLQDEIVVDPEFLDLVAKHVKGREVHIGIPFYWKGYGVKRRLKETPAGWHDSPFTQRFLPELSLLHSRLRVLTFDFLSDDTLRPLLTFEDNKFLPNIHSITFSGSTRHINTMPIHEVVTLLLQKLGPLLEIFSFLPETEHDLRGFEVGMVPPQVGAMPPVWALRGKLRVLELDHFALNDVGIGNLVSSCPQLRVLRLNEVRYWSDLSVEAIIRGLPELERLRIGGQSDLLTDRILYLLAESNIQFIELCRSYSHSNHAIENLRKALLGPVFLTGIPAMINYAAQVAGGYEPHELLPEREVEPRTAEAVNRKRGELYILDEDTPSPKAKIPKLSIGW